MSTIFLVLIGSGILFYKNVPLVKVKSTNNTYSGEAAETSTYRGIVTAGSNDCVVDGICALTIDRLLYVVIDSGRGMAAEPRKQLSINQLRGFDIYDLTSLVGKKVEAHIVGYDFTLKQKLRDQYPDLDGLPAYLDLTDNPGNYIKKLD